MNPTLPPGVAREAGPNGLERLNINTSAVQAQIYLHGAHLTHWQPKGQKPVLWMSQASQFAPGKPIRGGVPICFPWFGPNAANPNAPMHGFARLQPWTLETVQRDGSDGISIVLALAADDASRKLWPHDFDARFTVTLGPVLNMALTVANRGKTPFEYEEALHTYFAVGDSRTVHITGLAGASYIDKTDQLQRKIQSEAPITITAETDRLYLGTTATCAIHDPSLKRRITVAKNNSRATVVWNPWVAKSKAMPDFGDDEWTGMLCIETVNAAEEKVRVQPGAAHTTAATVRVEPL